LLSLKKGLELKSTLGRASTASQGAFPSASSLWRSATSACDKLLVLKGRLVAFVWIGRVLQAECDDLEMIGVALLYPALERSVCAPAIMDIRAHPISF
jgi:hypothetical protein